MERVLVHPFTTKHNTLAFYVPPAVMSHMTVVLAFKTWDAYALLQSDVHWQWALAHGNKLETRPQYNSSDCFETFPFPSSLSGLSHVGERHSTHVQRVCQAAQKGLTDLYNRRDDPSETSPDIRKLRDLHIELDRAVAAAYGWTDLDLGHGFHETKQGACASPSARPPAARCSTASSP